MLSEDIEAVIWDMDGTLLDTESLSHRCWLKARSELGIDCTAEDLKRIIGMNQQNYLVLLAEILDSEELAIKLQECAYEYYAAALEDPIPVKPGAVECVDFLASQGIPQAIATSSSRKFADKKLSSSGLLEKMNAIATGDEVAEGKPAPDIFLLAAERISAIPNRCLVFEDSKHGIVSAKAAGMYAALIPDIVEHESETLSLVDYHFESLDRALTPLMRRFS